VADHAGFEAGGTETSSDHRSRVDTSRLLLWALLATLLVDSALAATIAVLNVGYGSGVGHILGTSMWIAVAVLNLVAVREVLHRRPGLVASVLLAQVSALVMAGYVLVQVVDSPKRDPWIRLVAFPVAAVAVAWIVYVILKAPNRSGATFSRGWKTVSAVFAVMSLISLWLTTSYLPSTQRPLVDLTTSLTPLPGATADSTVLKATITLHNRGLASAVVVGSLYRIHLSENQGPTALPLTDSFGIDRLGQEAATLEALPATTIRSDSFAAPAAPTSAPSDTAPAGTATSTTASAPANTPEADGKITETHQDAVLKAAFDFTAANEHAFIGYENVLKADEIAPMREFLLPGQTWSTESVVTVPTAQASTVRLTAQVALITDRYLGATRACYGGTVDHHGVTFQQEAHAVGVTYAPRADSPEQPTYSERLDFLCLETTLEP